MGGLFKTLLGTSVIAAICYLGYQEFFADVSVNQDISHKERAINRAEFKKTRDYILGVTPANPEHDAEIAAAKEALAKAEAKKAGINKDFDQNRAEVNGVVAAQNAIEDLNK
ncbi:MAG: hypothetical protein ABIK25_07200 [Pseudomonadota bacterium]